MVKFGKQLEGELVPEWKEAFVDYRYLKQLVKKISLAHNNSIAPTNQQHKNANCFFFGQRFRHHGAIKVHKKLESSACKTDLYETRFLEEFGEIEGAEEFFTCLDLQLNKVNQFFKIKEKEFIERGESLKKQVNTLVELQTAKKNCVIGLSEDGAIIPRDEKSGEFDINNAQFKDTEKSDEMRKPTRTKSKDGKTGLSAGRTFNCQQKNVVGLLWEDLADKSLQKCNPKMSRRHINKMKLHQAEKMIKRALVELYKRLGYLKNYRNLNMLAFVKILKKFDKVTNKEVLPIYLKVVECSYFNISDKVDKLEDQIEEIFVEYFAEDGRKKAMKYLKPTHKKELHRITFFIGLFTGFSTALFAAYIIMAHIAEKNRGKYNTIYMETVFPVLSIFSLMFLHLFLYGCNIFMWKKKHISYGSIFDLLGHTKQPKYREIFLICSASMTFVMGILFLHLFLVAKGYSSSQVKEIPGLLLLVIMSLLFNPLNIFYKLSRFKFLSVIRNIVFSPLYKVTMLDSFMADQLCSEVPMLRELEYIACYYLTGSFKTQDYGYCHKTKSFRDLTYLVSFLPYYWRAMQCARRFLDDNEKTHLYNLGKYVSAMLAAGAKIAYEKERNIFWFCVLMVMSSVATIYQLYWDYVEDWGLLQRFSKNPWLRDDLLLRRKSLYFFSMGLNLIFRLTWVHSVVHKFQVLDHRVMGLFIAALEVIRRGQWNFYRLENVHVTMQASLEL